MKKYKAKKFNLPELHGISQKQIDLHIKLYEAYVNHFNLLHEKMREIEQEKKDETFLLDSLRKRLAFEFNGMRMHELYFEQFEEGPKTLSNNCTLAGALKNEFGSTENFLSAFKQVALSRGIGWALLSKDKRSDNFEVFFVADHELGQLADHNIILALDMWEHAFMADYLPSEKTKYIDAFFSNLNWEFVNNRFEKA